MRHVSTMTEGV